MFRSPSSWIAALGLGLGLGAWLAPQAALASGFAVARFAGEHGHPTADNPTSLYNNPAAVRGERAVVMLDGLLGVRQLSYTRVRAPSDAADPPGAERANVGRATLTNWLVSPSLWLSLPVSEALQLSAGIFTPFGGPISWDERAELAGSPYPGPVDGVTRFHAIEGLSITSYGSLGAAYALGRSGLRLGLSASLMYSRVEDVRAWSSGTNSVTSEGRSLLEVSGFAFGLGAGVFYEDRTRRLRLGASYQSRPNLAGGMTLSGRLSNDIGGPSSADVELHEDLPDIVRLGVSYRMDAGLELRAFGSWERWSAFERQCVTEAGSSCTLSSGGAQPEGGKVLQNVPRDFQDAFEARAGASIWPRKSLEIFSGIGLMSQAVPDATLDASLPDFFGVSFALGARVELSPALALAASYTQILSPPRSAQSRLSSYAPPSRLPDASGHYQQHVGFADLNATLRF